MYGERVGGEGKVEGGGREGKEGWRTICKVSEASQLGLTQLSSKRTANKLIQRAMNIASAMQWCCMQIYS